MQQLGLISLIVSLFLFLGFKKTFSQPDLWERTNGPYGGMMYTSATSSTRHILAGTRGGVFRSIDNGDNGSQIEMTDVTAHSLSINSSRHIHAGTEGDGVFCLKDSGDSWEVIITDLTQTYVPLLVISSKGHILAAAECGGAFRSTDNVDTAYNGTNRR